MTIGETVVSVWLCILLIVGGIKCIKRKDQEPGNKTRGITRLSFAVVDIPLLLCAAIIGGSVWTILFDGMMAVKPEKRAKNVENPLDKTGKRW